jgi:hypothetical protein
MIAASQCTEWHVESQALVSQELVSFLAGSKLFPALCAFTSCVTMFIRDVKLDACDTEPFGVLTGNPIIEANSFHLALLICLKSRWPKDQGRRREAPLVLSSLSACGSAPKIPENCACSTNDQTEACITHGVPMPIKLASIMGDNQDKALHFYTFEGTCGNRIELVQPSA